jgi:hypothetical protein
MRLLKIQLEAITRDVPKIVKKNKKTLKKGKDENKKLPIIKIIFPIIIRGFVISK